MSAYPEHHLSDSPEATMAIAETLARRVSPGQIITLSGDLGAGKTHFAKGFARRFGIPESEVSSPTYALVQEYRGEGPTIFHIDAYRLDSVEEALGIGLDETLDGEGICLVEWPERISSLLHPDAWAVRIEVEADGRRRISISRGLE